MREIKFKAWDKLDKKMYSVRSIRFNEKHEVERIIVLKEEKGAKYLHEILSSLFILLQYTGLKDRQGVEIYEGDIVKCDGYLWKIAWWENEACFSFECINEAFIATFDNYESNECEVLGNIYENPELLGEGNGD